MTVREAFEKAYGQLQKGVTCHIGHWAGPSMTGWMMEPTIKPEGISWPQALSRRKWGNSDIYEYVIGPDISDRPASAFLGFFGKEYDDVVNEADNG